MKILLNNESQVNRLIYTIPVPVVIIEVKIGQQFRLTVLSTPFFIIRHAIVSSAFPHFGEESVLQVPGLCERFLLINQANCLFLYS